MFCEAFSYPLLPYVAASQISGIPSLNEHKTMPENISLGLSILWLTVTSDQPWQAAGHSKNL